VTDLFVALGLVFVAELGDKTQLVALGMGAKHRLGPVLAGIAAGYAVTNLLSVVVGGLLGTALPTRAIGIGGGVLFLGFAVWTWLDRGDADSTDAGGTDEQATGEPTGRSWRVAASVAGAMIVAEMGDKTMLTTATLAARGNPVLVWIGATIGITMSGAVGVLAGRAIGARLSPTAIRTGAAVLFAVFGVVLIVTSL
jgi:Ca2+/H+ antiporter, TMEM165/GDT1 family